MFRGLEDYRILNADSVDGLRELVSETFEEGYLPIGGPFIHNDRYHQGVICLSPEEPEEEPNIGEFMHVGGM